MKPLLTLRATTNSIRNYKMPAQKIKNKGFDKGVKIIQ